MKQILSIIVAFALSALVFSQVITSSSNDSANNDIKTLVASMPPCYMN